MSRVVSDRLQSAQPRVGLQMFGAQPWKSRRLSCCQRGDGDHMAASHEASLPYLTVEDLGPRIHLSFVNCPFKRRRSPSPNLAFHDLRHEHKPKPQHLSLSTRVSTMSAPHVASSSTSGFFQTLPEIKPQYTSKHLANRTDAPTDDPVLDRLLKQYIPAD